MSVGGIVHNTVASMVVMALLAGVHPCVGMTGPSLPALSQTSGGQTVTLTCAGGPGSGGYISVIWYRNGVEIFQTSVDDPTVIYSPVNTSPEYQSVSGRISVSSSLKQHNVTLRTNSTLDQGSVWTCHAGPQFSNNLTIEVKEFIQGASSPGPKSTRDRCRLATEGQHTGPSSTEDKNMTTALVDPAVSTKCENILPIIAVAGSIIVVIVIVVAIATSVLLVRKYKQDIAESNNQMYSTMSRDPNTDNNYTELDHGHTGEKFPTSLSVDTKESPDYYNTAPADSQYENQPTSTE